MADECALGDSQINLKNSRYYYEMVHFKKQQQPLPMEST